MKKLFAACCAAFLLVVIVAPLAHAATEVNVRIEGKEETLFEKTIPVQVHPIEASSDTQQRNCDGVNQLDPENEVPGITPTLAAAAAMESIGEGFDGEWYDGFGDYFITRWGPDEQDNALGAWWGVLVNNVLTSVGGCQYQLNEDDEVLWLWNAFAATPRPLLALFPEAAGYAEGARPNRVTVAPGEPLPLEVVAYPAGGEGVAPGSPSRAGATAFEGADVSPVTVSPKGFQRVDTASPETVVSDAAGKATVTYAAPGLYRIKATVGAPGLTESVVRSNGLEICVETEPGECEPSPRSEAPGSTAAGGVPTTPTTQGAPAPPIATRIVKPRLDRTGLGHNLLKVSWKVLDQGAGVKAWRIGVKTLGGPRGFVTRAQGTEGTAASIRVASGHRYRLRITLTDDSGNTTRYGLGTVVVPRATHG